MDQTNHQSFALARCQAEKAGLESENAILREQLDISRQLFNQLMSRVQELEEQQARTNAMMFGQSSATGDLIILSSSPSPAPVQVDDARPVLLTHAQPDYDDNIHEGEEIAVSGQVATEGVAGLAYAHRIAKRGAVKLIAAHGSPLTAMYMTGEVTAGALMNLGNWGKWILVPIQGSHERFAFRSSHGYFMTVDGVSGRVSAKAKEITESSIFTAVELGLSNFAFVSFNGKYLSADPTIRWGRVVCDRLLISKWEAFQLTL
jgi:hypothetical protein